MDRRRRAARTVALMSLFTMADTQTDVPIASFVGDGSDLISLIVGIEPIQAGSGDPSPANVRPISGWTGAKVTRTGKNLLNPTLARGANNGITATKQADNSYSVTGTATGVATNVWIQGNYITDMNQFDALKIMFFKAGTKLTIKDCKAFFTSADGAHKNQVIFSGAYYYIGDSAYTITIPYDCWLTGVRIPDTVSGTAYNTTLYPQVEIGDVASSYEKYQGNQISVTFPSSAGTVYGGTLDVTTGKLTVDRANIASYNGEPLPSTWISDRDVYAVGTTPTTGAQVVYELATPIVYDLTPTQVTTLIGTNNIWADTGDIKYIEYNI